LATRSLVAMNTVKGDPESLKLDTAFTDITSDTDAGKRKLVFFWPKDFTFVCPTEIVAFGRLAGDFADRDTVVYGVSGPGSNCCDGACRCRHPGY
jgi:lipoyl-dependent peroxiredoxin subunit C